MYPRTISACLFIALLLAHGAGCRAPSAAPPDRAAAVRPAAGAAACEVNGRRFQRLDLQANTFTMSTQNAAGLDQDPQGRYVVTWHSRRQERGNYGIFAQRFDAAGRRLGPELHVNTYTQSRQTAPLVALDDHGGAWFAWESFLQDGDAGSVVARRFDAALQPLTADIVVNEIHAGHQGDIALASAADGRAAVAWSAPGTASRTRRIRMRFLDPDGRPQTAVIDVHAPDGAVDRRPQVGFDPAGNLIVAWCRTALDGRPLAIVVRRFDAQGRALGAEQVVSPPDGAMHLEPTLAVAADGSFSLCWATGVPDGYALLLRHFDTHGRPLGPAGRVDQGTVGNTTGLTAARTGEHCAVAWGHYDHATGTTALHGRLVDTRGRQLGAIFPCTAHREGNQKLTPVTGARRLVLGADGRLALAWSGDAGGEDDSAVHLTFIVPDDVDLTRIAARPAKPPAASAAPEPHQPPTFRPKAQRPTRQDVMAAEGPGDPDFGFVGIVDTGWNPPDPHLAVGPEAMVAVTNGAIAAFTKDGDLIFEDAIEDAGGFWGDLGAGLFVFDPEVLYDPLTDRFLALANEKTGGQPFLLLAVTATGDPGGDWYKYRFNVQAEADDFDIDSPNLAVDQDTIYMTADFFGPDKYLMFMVDKAEVLDGEADPMTNSLLHTGSHSWGLAVNLDDPAAQYMAEAIISFSAQSTIELHALTDPMGDPPQLETFTLSVPTYSRPEDPPSMGTTERIETFDARFWSCMYRNGYLWATHHTGSNRVVQRWYQIAMNGWPADGTPELVQWGDVDIDASTRTYFGSVWADPLNNAALVFARSSPSELISMNRTFRLDGDAAGTLRPVTVVRESAVIYTDDRWGDYSSVVTDPAQPGAFWGHHQYYAADGWRTWITQFFLPPLLVAEVQMSPAMVASSPDAPITRCLELQVRDCEAGLDWPLFADVVYGAEGQPAGFGSVVLELPEGVWECASGRDPKHTLRASCPVVCDENGRVCTVSFTGSPQQDPNCHWLIMGNFNGDSAIDVTDLSLLNSNYFTTAEMTTDCVPFTTHADLNGDGIVSMADLQFIMKNFLALDSQVCAALCGGGPAPDPQPRLEIAVEELLDLGIEQAAAWDDDGDGFVDVDEILQHLGDTGAHPTRQPDRKVRRTRK